MFEQNKSNTSGLDKGRILLMDDDEILLGAINKLLETFGYEVKICTNGHEAVELYKKAIAQDNPFDVVIIDLNIPDGMGGKQTMEKLLGIDFTAKGIVSSGYPNDSVIMDYEKHGFSGAIEKPYRIELLDSMICNIIEGSAN